MSRSAVQKVREDFHRLLLDANAEGYDRRFPCFGKPEQYVDYDHSPSPQEAEEMCVGCPIFAECREYGRVTKPGWGVHGGIAYRYGKPIRKTATVTTTVTEVEVEITATKVA